MNHHTIPCLLDQWTLAHSRLFLRADANVPLDQKQAIVNDYRLTSLKPTLDFLIAQQATIVFATHIGRPKGYEARLSTKHLIPWFEQQGYPVTFNADLDHAYQASMQHEKGIILLENMRFFKGEKNHDQQFITQLAQLGDYYVNEAFGLLHRTDSSLVDVPLLFPPDRRSIGFLIEKELSFLSPIRDNPIKPFVIFLGGGKVHDKIPFLKTMVKNRDTIALCPAPVFTFLYAQDKSVGRSLVDYTAVEVSKEIIDYAKKHNADLYFPTDYLIADTDFNGPLRMVPAHSFPADGFGIAIGSQTIQTYTELIADAKTIFYNGLMGSIDRPETVHPANQLFYAMANSDATTVIGGGDSVAAAQLCGIADKITHLSTGGGATLAYISKQPLPGLIPFYVD